MHTKNHTIPNSRWYPFLGIIEFLIYYCIFDYIFIMNVFGPTIFGTIKALLCTMLLYYVIETVKEKWRSSFKAAVYGNVILKSDNVPSIPIDNVEISWGPYHHLTQQDTPVITDAEGEFHFDNLPLRPNLTLTAKLPNNRYVHHTIGDFEGIRWLLGLPWLGLPISSGVPKHVDFIVPPVEVDFVEEEALNTSDTIRGIR